MSQPKKSNSDWISRTMGAKVDLADKATLQDITLGNEKQMNPQEAATRLREFMNAQPPVKHLEIKNLVRGNRE